MSEMSRPKISEVMHRLYSVVEELESIYPGRPFTPGGHMVGSISECLVADKDFDCGVKLAVNHSGDSDSTGAIAGDILGVLLGRDGLSG